MKPAPFKYFAPHTIDEALQLLAEYGYDAKLLAGGQSFVPAMNFRLAQPAVLIDLNPVDELFFLSAKTTAGLSIGAMTRQRTLERNPLIMQHTPLISETMPFIAHPQIRNRGTVGGSIAHADPAAELPAVMLALDARFCLRSTRGERWISATEFFIGMFATALEPDELLVEITIPFLPKQTGCAFTEIARRHGDYALLGVTAMVKLDTNAVCTEAKIVFLSAGDRPVLASTAAQLLAGQPLSDATIDAAAATAAQQDIDPGSDIHASAAYRRHLAAVLTRQVLAKARERARSAITDGAANPSRRS